MGNNPKILFVDDESEILNSIKRVLIHEDYKTFFASNGDEAIRILDSEDIWVIVTDLLMPGMDGISLLKIVKKRFPHIIRIIATGIADVGGILYAVRTGETHRYITKPVNIKDELIPILNQSCEIFELRTSKENLLKELEEANKLLKNKNEEIGYLRQIETDLNDEREQRITDITKRTGSFIDNTEDIIMKLKESDCSEHEVANYLKTLRDFRESVMKINLYCGDIKFDEGRE